MSITSHDEAEEIILDLDALIAWDRARRARAGREVADTRGANPGQQRVVLLYYAVAAFFGLLAVVLAL